MINVYLKNRGCAKCGSLYISDRYHFKEGSGACEVGCYWSKCEDEPKSHIARVCNNCKSVWYEWPLSVNSDVKPSCKTCKWSYNRHDGFVGHYYTCKRLPKHEDIPIGDWCGVHYCGEYETKGTEWNHGLTSLL